MASSLAEDFASSSTRVSNRVRPASAGGSALDGLIFLPHLDFRLNSSEDLLDILFEVIHFEIFLMVMVLSHQERSMKIVHGWVLVKFSLESMVKLS